MGDAELLALASPKFHKLLTPFVLVLVNETVKVEAVCVKFATGDAQTETFMQAV